MTVIDLDYIPDLDTLRRKCPGLPTDYELLEWEMLMRLRIDDVEVFGSTEEEFQRWLDRLRRNNLPLRVPSSAWTNLSVLWIALGVDEAFRRLKEAGTAALNSLDSLVHLACHDDLVRIYLRKDRIGQAPFGELYSVFESFAERVRGDFLSACPGLEDHVTLGPWFRTGKLEPAQTEYSEPIHLPPMQEPNGCG